MEPSSAPIAARSPAHCRNFAASSTGPQARALPQQAAACDNRPQWAAFVGGYRFGKPVSTFPGYALRRLLLLGDRHQRTQDQRRTLEALLGLLPVVEEHHAHVRTDFRR